MGPTASGKSALAVEVARRTGSEILAVDSMAVYRGMDIGTATPSASERAGIAHHLIDLVEATATRHDEKFVIATSAGDVVRAAARLRRVCAAPGMRLLRTALRVVGIYIYIYIYIYICFLNSAARASRAQCAKRGIQSADAPEAVSGASCTVF